MHSAEGREGVQKCDGFIIENHGNWPLLRSGYYRFIARYLSIGLDLRKFAELSLALALVIYQSRVDL